MKKQLIWATLISAIITLPVGWVFGQYFNLPQFFSSRGLISPLAEGGAEQTKKELPLNRYTIENLNHYPYQASQIKVATASAETEDYITRPFTYQTLGKTMSGQLHLPTSPTPTKGYPVIIMLRGWVPPENYQPGMGTHAAAEVFAQNGYVTLAPDFFGYGQSDSESENSWETRLQKPVSVIELIQAIREKPALAVAAEKIRLNSNRLAFWGHSNGGQIALTTLEILQEPIPTTLWAPVTAPFPYSILFYSDEHDDEGQEMRKWLSLFEEDYDVHQFSLTQYLDRLTGPIQIHQGTNDDAVPMSWNDEFVDKVEAASNSAELIYYQYPGANHNLQPSWDSVIQRDLKFFSQ